MANDRFVGAFDFAPSKHQLAFRRNSNREPQHPNSLPFYHSGLAHRITVDFVILPSVVCNLLLPCRGLSRVGLVGETGAELWKQ